MFGFKNHSTTELLAVLQYIKRLKRKRDRRDDYPRVAISVPFTFDWRAFFLFFDQTLFAFFAPFTVRVIQYAATVHEDGRSIVSPDFFREGSPNFDVVIRVAKHYD